jgi:hypothetical protein
MRIATVALDHLVLATPDLEATAARVAESTGVTPSAGGRHLGHGTRNMLCSLGPNSYLEIIGPDQDQDQGGGRDRRLFGIDELTEDRFVGWAIAASGIDALVTLAAAAGHHTGEPVAMHRERPDETLLSWRLTMPQSTTIPFLIDWESSPHPAIDAAPGLELVELRAQHPDPVALIAALTALGVTMGVELGPEALLVEIRGPLGRVALT